MTHWNIRKLRDGRQHLSQSINPITGTSTNSLVEVIDLDTRAMNENIFTISNIGSNDLYYSVLVRNEYTDGEDHEIFFNKIGSSNNDELILACHARIFICIKSHVNDQHTTYKIDGIGSN